MANHGRPLKMFTDKDEDWPIWEIDFEGWSIRNGFKRFLKRTDPKTIPRVDRSYTVTTPGDPNGSTGVYIRYESRSNYEDRCNNYAQGKY
jgi:hypothetical protein